MNYSNKSKDLPLLVCIGIVYFIIYIFMYTNSTLTSYESYAPQFMLSAVVVTALYFGDGVGAVFGLCFGTFVDAVSYGTYCFNSIAFLLIGYFVGLLITTLFNNNFKTAIIFFVVTSFIYFFVKWIVLGCNPYYINNGFIKSVMLTAIFSIPIYYIVMLMIYIREKQLNK